MSRRVGLATLKAKGILLFLIGREKEKAVIATTSRASAQAWEHLRPFLIKSRSTYYGSTGGSGSVGGTGSMNSLSSKPTSNRFPVSYVSGEEVGS